MEAPHVDAGVAQARLDGGIHPPLRPAVSAVPEHRPGSQFVDESRQLGLGRASAQHERAAEGGDVSAESGEAAVQPPAARGTERPDARALLVEQIEDGDGPAAIDGGAESGIVCEAKVVAQPDDAR
jgi:hypothetical protein